MADPFNLRVLKAVCATIKTVTPANGFVNDLSDYTDEAGVERPRVFRGIDEFGQNYPLPLVSVLEDPSPLPLTMGGGGTVVGAGDWGLVIQGFVPDDFDHPTDPAHLLAAEVLSVLARSLNDPLNRLGMGPAQRGKGHVLGGELTRPVIRPADGHVSSVAFFYMPITLRMVENLAEPFNS